MKPKYSSAKSTEHHKNVDESEVFETTFDELEKEKEAEIEVYKCRERIRRYRWPVWLDFAETTTLHGPIHITTTKGGLRVYYSIVISLMTAGFLSHALHLYRQYISCPVLTEIKHGNIDFDYPDITLCPNSPFASSEITNSSHIFKNLEKSREFWWQTKGDDYGSPRVHIKRSLLSSFYALSDTLGKKPYQQILDCQVKSQECLENFIITEHPIYYRCFTLRVRPTPPVPAGPTHGIRLIIHRGIVNASPLLMVVEEEPNIIQSSETERTAYLKDGYFIAFHEVDTFPVFPVQSLPNGLSIRFGDTMRIALEQTYHEAVNLVGRVCVDDKYAPSIELVKLDKLSQSNSQYGEGITRFKYTRQACVAVLRQKLTYETCKCFSESYAIPYSMHNIGQVWCHDIMDSTTKMIRVWDTLKCADGIANLSDHEVLQRIQPSVPGDGIINCPLRCRRRLNNIHSSIRTKTVQNIDPKTLIPYLEMLQLNGINDSYVKADSPLLKAEDLIFIDIHPVNEMVNQIIEGPGYYMARFISDLGGISGLYVGVTFYTIAEVIDLFTQYLCLYIPYFYSVMHLQMLKEKNMARKIKRRLQLAMQDKAMQESGI
ncbi:unnamed protein product [Trichobilharzia szidati]|nr:unnamed protein product [Trichobilharzia szidati]